MESALLTGWRQDTDKLAFGLAEVEHLLEDEAVRPLWDWLGRGVAYEADKLDEQVERSLGKRPWWRRLSGA
jgi:hypothetical protein